MITQKLLKELLHYNPDTGVFTWIGKSSQKNHMITIGDVANSRCNGYIVMKIRGKTYQAHRLAFLYMTGMFPEKHTDHINHVRDDNRWCNLRAVTNLENHKNLPHRRNNTSGTMGVFWRKDSNKWRAAIQVDGALKWLGTFITKDEAIAARTAALKKHGFHKNHGAKS